MSQLASIFSISSNIQQLAQQQSQRKLQWSIVPKEQFITSSWGITQINKVVDMTTSSNEWRQERFGSRKSLSHWGIAQLPIRKEASGLESTRYALLTQWRERKVDWGFRWERNRQGKKVSWRGRGSGSATAGGNEESWHRGIDAQRARNELTRDRGSHRRQSDWSRKFREWGRWGGWGWWRDRAGYAEQRWRTRLGDGHIPQNGTAADGEVSAEADEAWIIDATWLGGLSQLSRWERYEVRHIWFDVTRRCWTANIWWCSRTFTDNIWWAYGVSWHCAWKIPHAARNFWTRK